MDKTYKYPHLGPLQEIFNSLEELSEVFEKKEEVIIFRYRDNVRKLVYLYRRIKNYFEDFLNDSLQIKNYEALLKKISDYSQEIDSLINDQFDLCSKIKGMLLYLDEKDCNKFKGLVNLKFTIPLVKIEVKLIDLVINLYNAISKKETIEIKNCISELIKLFDDTHYYIADNMEELRLQLETIEKNITHENATEVVKKLMRDVILYTEWFIKTFDESKFEN
jgi:hypothetical protein